MTARHIRLLRILAAVLLVGAIAALVLVPRVGEWAIRRALTALEGSAGVRASVGAVDLDLPALRVDLSELRLAASSTPDQPFVTVESLTIDLPWSVVWGLPALEELVIVGPAVTVTHAADGRSNLPAFGSDEDPSPPLVQRLPIGRLEIRDLTVAWRDAVTPLTVALAPVTIELTGTGGAIRGPLRMDGASEISWQGRATTLSRLAGELGFDGESLDFDRLVVVATEGEATLDGTVASIISDPTLALDIDSEWNLDRVAPWLDAPTAAGRLTVAGEVTGPLDALAVVAAIAGDEPRWGDVALDRVETTVRYTASTVAFDPLRVDVAGGELSAEGRVELGETMPGQVTARWRDLDIDRLLAALGAASPVAVGTVATGDLEARWDALDPGAVTVTARNRSVRGAVSGETRVDADGGWWRLSLDEPVGTAARVAGSVETRLGDDWSTAPLDGSVSVECSDLAGCSRLVEAWRGSGPPVAVAGSLTARVDLDGTLGRPRVAGRVEAPRVDVDDLTATGVTARVAVDGTTLTVDDTRLAIGDSIVSGRMQLDWSDGAVDGAVIAAPLDLAAVAALLPPAWALAGDGAVEATVDGSLDRLSADATLSFQEVELAGQRFDVARARVRLDGDAVAIDEVMVARGDGRVALGGTYDLTTREVDLTATADAFPVTPVFPATADEIPVQMLVTFEVSADGPVDEVMASGRVALADLTWGDHPVGPVRGTVGVDAAGLRVEAQLSDLAATVSATLGLDGEQRFEVRGRLADADLTRLVAGAAPVTGRLTAEATASGALANLDATEVVLSVDRLAGEVGAVGFETTRPALVHYSAGRLDARDLGLALGGARLALDGALTADGDATLTARLTGDLSGVARALSAVSGFDAEAAGLTGSGGLSGEITASGPVDRLALAGFLRLEDAAFTLADRPAVTDVTLDLSIDDDAVRLQTLQARWAGATLDAAGELPLDLVSQALPSMLAVPPTSGRPARLRASLEALTPTLLAPYLDPATLERLAGQAAAVIDIEAASLDVDAIRARMTLPEASFVVSGVPIEQRQPTELVLEDGGVRVATFDWGNERDYVTLGGVVALGGEPTADLTVTGEIDLRIASAFLPDVATGGVARLIANVSGPVTRPDLRGTLEIEGGELRVGEPRLVVSDLTGALLLTGDTVTVHELVGEANGGRLEIGGAWSFAELAEANRLTFSGTELALEIPSGLRSEADVDLRLAETTTGLSIEGTATILRGAYREPFTLAGGALAAFQQVDPGVATVGLDGSDASLLDAITLNIRVVTAEDIIIDNNYVDAELGVDVRAGGSIAQPAVTGRVALREGGRVRFGNRVYEIDTGSVDLVDPNGIEPDLSLTARTRVGTHDITLEVSGGPDDLTTDFRSDSQLPESDIVSLLLTGRTLEQASAAPGAGARDQAVGLFSSELLGQAGRSVGLDVRVGTDGADAGSDIQFDSSLIATELNPGARLTVGRDLSDQVRLIFSQSLRENDLAWLVDYLPLDNIELRAFFDDQNARAYEFRHALSLGAPPRGAEAADPRRRETSRVGAVRFAGEPGFEPDTLRERLTLAAGDTFDFYRWQRDRDRLEALYRDERYLEARIRARRDRAADSGPVELEYQIVRGPRTELEVVGYSLPGDVRRDLDDAWARSVFDTFLVEEIETRVTRDLVENGYLQSTVAVDVTRQDADAKRIVVTVEPGPRSDDRRLVFEGVAAADERSLFALVEGQGVARLAWVDPSPLTGVVVAWYRERGYLRASAAVEPPRFDGASAALPVVVAPGPVFHVASLALEGVESRPPAEVRALIGIDLGAVYRERQLGDARARIEDGYRRAGYTAARVTAETAVDPAAATVAIRLGVTEGPRQILEEVVVEGAPRTHPNLVANALRLNPGTPVDLGAWNEARKRLYDTGVFRSVDIQARALEGDAGGSDATVPVEARVVLEEWPLYRIRYGLRVSDELAPASEITGRVLRVGAAGDISRRNLLGRGLRVGASSRVDLDRQAVRGFLTVPTWFGRALETNLFASRLRDVEGETGDEIVTDVTTFTLEQRLNPREPVTLAYSATFDNNHSFETNPRNPDFVFDIVSEIVRFNGSAAVDTRDNLFNATRGLFHSSNFEYGFELEGFIKFTKYLGQQFYYRRLGPVVLASAARVGLAAGLGGSRLLVTERFFTGGGNTVRGYGQDSLGPVGIFGTAEGGNALVVLNQEVRFPLVWRVGGVGFLDAGNVFSSIGDISVADLRKSAGFGLRVESPIGLLRLDYGFALDRADDDPRGRFFFSLGQAF